MMKKVLVFEDNPTEIAVLQMAIKRIAKDYKISLDKFSEYYVIVRNWGEFADQFSEDTQGLINELQTIETVFLDHAMVPGPDGDVVNKYLRDYGFSRNIIGTSDHPERQLTKYDPPITLTINKDKLGDRVAEEILKIMETERVENTEIRLDRFM